MTCSTQAFTLGGTIVGLSGTIGLLDNGGDALSVSANGAFTFVTPVASGAAYAVTIGTQPTGQSCAASGGAGTVGSANVTSVVINCGANHTVGGTIAGLAGLGRPGERRGDAPRGDG